jgi:hypothetical protein
MTRTDAEIRADLMLLSQTCDRTVYTRTKNRLLADIPDLIAERDAALATALPGSSA